jgi:hypothetical protein
MRRLAPATALAVLATTLAAGGVSAHHPTDITVTPRCADRTLAVTVGYASFSDGHFLNIEVSYAGDGTEAVDTGPLEGTGTVTRRFGLDGYTGTVTVTAQAHEPDGSPEGKPVVVTRDYSCPKPPPRVYEPRASLQGPCGDPMYRAVFDNRASNRDIPFKWVRRSHGVTYRYRRTVPAGKRVFTPFLHVDGRTRTFVRARGETLVSIVSAPGGDYRPCSTVGLDSVAR